MPPRGVTKGTKRASQYEHIKEGELERAATESGPRSRASATRLLSAQQLADAYIARGLEQARETLARYLADRRTESAAR